MASAQCQRPPECRQGQEVSEVASWAVKKESRHGKTDIKTQCSGQTQTCYSENGAVVKTQTQCSSQTISSGKTSRWGQHKSLLQKIKDGISRHLDKDSSSSSSSSSSESESDDEKKCDKRKK